MDQFDDDMVRALQAPVEIEGADVATIGELLGNLAAGTWSNSNWNGKRPFGNSGWHWDVYAALIKAGLISGRIEIDAEGSYVETLNDDERAKADALILAACAYLGRISSL